MSSPWFPLERTGNVAGNPAAIKSTGLWSDNLTIDRAFVHFRRIEGDVVAQICKGRARVAVRPTCSAKCVVVHDDIEVSGATFPFAIAPPISDFA